MKKLFDIAAAHAIRKMTPDVAETFLADYDIPEDQLETIHKLVGKDIVTNLDLSRPRIVSYSYDPDKRFWLAAAWVLGASYKTLADLHHVSPQAVTQSVQRVWRREPKPERLGYETSLERISAWKAAYYNNLPLMRTMRVIEAAKWILTHAEYDDAE